MMDDQNLSYRELHEQFVSNHEGGSTLEIVVVTGMCGALSVLFRNLLKSWLFFTVNRDVKLSRSAEWTLEFVILVLPVLCCLTIAADHSEAFMFSLISANIGLLLVSDKVTSLARPDVRQHLSWTRLLDIKMPARLPFISAFRACVQLATAISILAVDFRVFPRRFCKAETYGTGLMDVGVGAFVVANAVVSPEARGKYSIHSSMPAKLRSVMRSLTSSLPLWILGLCRLAAVKGSDYQEHVSEYGVHWNFFFTLAMIKVLSTCVLCIVHPSFSWLASVVLGCGYQYLLTGPLELREFILFGSDGRGSRDGLLNANREGIASSFGYLAIYFAGVQLGIYLMKPRKKLSDWLQCLLCLTLLDVAVWTLLAVSQQSVEPASRRLANLPYVIWTLAHNIQVVWGCLLVDIICVVLDHIGLLSIPGDGDNSTVTGEAATNHKPLCLLEAINNNGLLFFLMANLQTGVVNLTMETLNADSLTAMAVLTAHMLTLTVTVSVLYVYTISVKFW